MDVTVNGRTFRFDDVARDTLRVGDRTVVVRTSYLPINRVYETLVTPGDWASRVFGGDGEQVATRDEAELVHRFWVSRVRFLADALAAQRAGVSA